MKVLEFNFVQLHEFYKFAIVTIQSDCCETNAKTE